ncbi:hypothetical protein [Frankia sp. Cj3]|uniref:hypothetical protein n=1 Tax=Frankia sp. Cj3 TaxID=2880976 RepID=UPI001EF4AB5F|nr:hypothetical protein [Frankia sp. Cj3]
MDWAIGDIFPGAGTEQAQNIQNDVVYALTQAARRLGYEHQPLPGGRSAITVLSQYGGHAAALEMFDKAIASLVSGV